MRVLLISLIVWAITLSAAAQTVVDSPEAAQTSLTIYPDNLAMVTEVRRVTLPKGPATIRFLGVSDQIIPQSAVLQEFEGLNLERNFDADIITKGSLMEKAVGETITIRRVNPATGDVSELAATLLAAPLQHISPQRRRWERYEYIRGAVFEINGKIEALNCSGLAEAVIYNQLPDGLNPSPVLSLAVESETAGERDITISYLTRGLGWEADYRLDMAPKSKEGSLLGWLTLTNGTSKLFENVPTAIVAGTLNLASDEYRAPLPRIFTPNCWAIGSTKKGIKKTHQRGGGFTPPPPPPAVAYLQGDLGEDEVIATGIRQAVREDLGDYKLYRTPEPVTVPPMQTKQVVFAVDLPVDIEVSESISVQMQSRIEGVSRENEDKPAHEIRLSADIYNATGEIVQTEIEIRDIFLRQDDIGETSHAADPDKIVPTYPISLKPESAERFTLVVPVQEIYYFDYNDIDFDDKRYIGKVETSYAAGRYGLSSNLGAENWATEYFNDVTGVSVKIDTTLLSYSEDENDEGDDEITAKLKHVVKNTTDKTVKIAFVLPDGFENIRVLTSSIALDENNHNTWLLDLKSGQRKTLSYEIIIQD